MQQPVVTLVVIASIAAASIVTAETAHDSRKRELCQLHHVKLVHATAYDIIVPPRSTADLGDEQAAIWKKYPNAIYPLYSLHRDAAHPKPIVVTYCPVCQRLYDRAFRSHANASNQAMQLTAGRSEFPLCVTSTPALQSKLALASGS